ncbi:MAG: hypothetical protein AB7I29_14880 [Geobacter sp.]
MPHTQHGLTPEEYDRIAKIAGGIPNWEKHGRGQMGMGEFKRKVVAGEYPHLVTEQIAKEKAASEAETAKQIADNKKLRENNTQVTAMPEGTPVKQVTYKITKVGRKWIEGTVPGKGWKAQIEINSATSHMEIGKEYTFTAGVATEFGKYGTSTKVYPLSQENHAQAIQQTKTAERLKEINKWLGYVEEKAKKEGYVYTNGTAKLRELGIASHPELYERMKAAVSLAETKQLHSEANRALGYIEQNIKQYWYNNGEAKLISIMKLMRQAGIDTSQYDTRLKGLKEQYKNNPERKQKEQARQQRDMIPLSNAPPLNTPIRDHGRVIVYESTGKTFRIGEDDPSLHGSHLLGHEGESAKYFYYRTATDDEIAKLEAKEQASRDRRQAEQELDRIAAKIKEKGEYQTTEQPEGERIEHDGKQNEIYGGGRWFVVGKQHIWHVTNNGMDGDNWGNNNVRTGGAGAIGYRVPHTEALESAIRDASRRAN